MLVLFTFVGFTSSVISEEVPQKIKAFTASLPPFSMDPKSKFPGFSYEIVSEMAKRSNIDLEVVYLPWKRAQETAKKTPNSLVFGMSRTKKREPHYSWVVELITSNYAFMTTKEHINSYQDARALKDISAMFGTPRERILMSKKFTNYSKIYDVRKAATRLRRGRTDAWFTLTHRAAYIWREQGYPENDLIIGKSLKVTHNWLGGNKQLPKGLVENFQKSLVSMKKDGTYNKIYRKYFGNFKL